MSRALAIIVSGAALFLGATWFVQDRYYQLMFTLVPIWATVGVAAVRVDGNVRVALTSMGPTPLRARGVEEALAGGASAADAAARASEGTSPASDTSGSAEYRSELARVLTRRALERLA